MNMVTLQPCSSLSSFSLAPPLPSTAPAKSLVTNKFSSLFAVIGTWSCAAHYVGVKVVTSVESDAEANLAHGTWSGQPQANVEFGDPCTWAAHRAENAAVIVASPPLSSGLMGKMASMTAEVGLWCCWPATPESWPQGNGHRASV